jgi:error-prone DNA polymerase
MFRQSPYADIKPPGDDAATAARKEGANRPRKLWHTSPGSPGG